MSKKISSCLLSKLSVCVCVCVCVSAIFLSMKIQSVIFYITNRKQ